MLIMLALLLIIRCCLREIFFKRGVLGQGCEKRYVYTEKERERESEIDVSHFFLSKISQSRPKIDASQYEGNLLLYLVASVLGHFS